MTDTHKHKFAAIILAAGKGTRMKSALPKVMHRLAGKPLIAHVYEAILPLRPDHTIAVLADGMDDVKHAVMQVAPHSFFATQTQQLGTGDAVKSALPLLKSYEGTVVVLYGDVPLITTSTIDALLESARTHEVVVVGMRVANPTGYGRLIVDSEHHLDEIVEEKDANAAQEKITLCNSGIMAIRGKHLPELLSKLTAHNAAGEYYLTDIVGIANEHKLHCHVIEADATELSGINTRVQLAEAEATLQHRLRVRAMENGATLVDPASVFLATDTQIGRDVVIHPNVFFGTNVVVEDGVEIRSFSHLDGVHIHKNAIIGPFARLRPGSVVGEEAHVGNFVELKKATLGTGAKANHLSYIGDSVVGAGANIGAGTITCNYDGINKHITTIGEGAFIGSNSSLVAPVTIGDGAVIGAGSVITQDVEAGALALERGEQIVKKGKGRKAS